MLGPKWTHGFGVRLRVFPQGMIVVNEDGLEDAYEYEHGSPLEEDIMGLGRNKPIGEAYLSEKAKRGMGIVP